MSTVPALEIRIKHQVLRYEGRQYSVSTSKNGPGERLDSECTPCGRHRVVEKFGDGCSPGAVFVARRPTGEIYSPELATRHPGRDWILTRILRLAGCEEGINLGGEVDTYRRCIYIHGAPDDTPMGIPGSRGCIRMLNRDVMELYENVPLDTPVLIIDA